MNAFLSTLIAFRRQYLRQGFWKSLSNLITCHWKCGKDMNGFLPTQELVTDDKVGLRRHVFLSTLTVYLRQYNGASAGLIPDLTSCHRPIGRASVHLSWKWAAMKCTPPWRTLDSSMTAPGPPCGTLPGFRVLMAKSSGPCGRTPSTTRVCRWGSLGSGYWR